MDCDIKLAGEKESSVGAVAKRAILRGSAHDESRETTRVCSTPIVSNMCALNSISFKVEGRTCSDLVDT